MFNRLVSPNMTISGNERAKVVSEIAILRSSIDPLPDITDSLSEMSPRGGVISNNNNNSSYKQRIRSSAGGGVGPSYKMDSR